MLIFLVYECAEYNKRIYLCACNPMRPWKPSGLFTRNDSRGHDFSYAPA